MIFGGRVRDMAKLSPQDQKFLVNTISLLVQVAEYSAVAVVASFFVRFFFVRGIGQILAAVGALIVFVGPPAMLHLADPAVIANHLFVIIINEIALVGLIFLLPGLALVIRDIILRIWDNLTERKEILYRWGDEHERRKRNQKPKVYGKCWDMPFCRDFVKRVCPAAKAKKPCWRIKVGCYCDEATILRALTPEGKQNPHLQGIMESLGLDRSRGSVLSPAQKRARCRRCGIYAEHQRQKYRILSPLVFPLVIISMYIYRAELSAVLGIALAKADKFLSFLAYRPGTVAYSFTDDGRILTTMAIIWLGIMLISYSLRFLEYLIFDLQV